MWNYYSQTSMDGAFLIAFQEMRWWSEDEESWTYWLFPEFSSALWVLYYLMKFILSAHFDLLANQFPILNMWKQILLR